MFRVDICIDDSGMVKQAAESLQGRQLGPLNIKIAEIWSFTLRQEIVQTNSRHWDLLFNSNIWIEVTVLPEFQK